MLGTDFDNNMKSLISTQDRIKARFQTLLDIFGFFRIFKQDKQGCPRK